MYSVNKFLTLLLDIRPIGIRIKENKIKAHNKQTEELYITVSFENFKSEKFMNTDRVKSF